MDEWIEGFIMNSEKSFSQNVKLSNYSWFNLGGNAEYFFKAQNKNELIEIIKDSKKKKTYNNNHRCWF